ncbi:MAG: hypothetical protein ABIF77_13425 [bacterium]
MKRLLIALAIVCLASTSFAQVDPDPDGVGMYFDLDGMVYCNTFTGGPASVYLLLTNQSVDTGVGGFEAHVDYTVPAGNFEQGWTLPPSAINVSTAPDFVVGFGVALPHSNAIVLATYGVLVFGVECMTFNVRASDSGNLLYADGVDPGLLIPMQVSSNGSPYGAGLNCADCLEVVLDSDQQTWGQMKSLYR